MNAEKPKKPIRMETHAINPESTRRYIENPGKYRGAPPPLIGKAALSPTEREQLALKAEPKNKVVPEIEIYDLSKRERAEHPLKAALFNHLFIERKIPEKLKEFYRNHKDISADWKSVQTDTYMGSWGYFQFVKGALYYVRDRSVDPTGEGIADKVSETLLTSLWKDEEHDRTSIEIFGRESFEGIRSKIQSSAILAGYNIFNP